MMVPMLQYLATASACPVSQGVEMSIVTMSIVKSIVNKSQEVFLHLFIQH